MSRSLQLLVQLAEAHWQCIRALFCMCFTMQQATALHDSVMGRLGEIGWYHEEHMAVSLELFV